MRALVWIVAETWQAPVAAAAAFLAADADVTLLHVRAGDAETVARGARSALLGRPRRPAGAPLEVICEQGARDLLAEAQAASAARPCWRRVRAASSTRSSRPPTPRT